MNSDRQTFTDLGASSEKPRPRDPAHAYRADIDGLRAIAILSVVFYHARIPHVSGGFTGVDIFFVISGYLIGGHIHGDLVNGRFSFRKFYERRVRRILPALYAVLAFILLVAAILCSPGEFATTAKSTAAATASLSNFLFWKTTGYFTANSDRNPLLMTWSLGVEEQFYLVIPILMAVSFRIRRGAVVPIITAIGAVSLAMSTHLLKTDPTAAFYLPQSRAWELAIGVALAILVSGSRRVLAWRAITANAVAIAGAGLIIVPIFTLSQSTPFPGFFAIPSVVGTALLLGAQQSWINRRVLALPPFVRVGQVSYSWYLWHWPLLALFRTVTGGPLPIRWSLAVIALAYGLAVLSYRSIEQPFRKLKSGDGLTLLRYAAVSFALLVIAAGTWRMHGWPERYPAMAPLEAAVDEFHQSRCLLDAVQSQLNLARACIDENSSRPKVAVWGDSHAAALAPALRIDVESQGYGLAQFTKVQCPPLLSVARAYKEEPAQVQSCASFNSNALQYLLNSPSIKIVVLTSYWEAPFDPMSTNGKLVAVSYVPGKGAPPLTDRDLLKDSLQLTVKTLQAAGKRVVLVGDVPVFGIDPIWRMTTSRIPFRETLFDALGSELQFDSGSDVPVDNVTQEQDSRQFLRAVAENIPGVVFWDPRSRFCDDATNCRYREGEVPLYLDGDHLSQQGGLVALAGSPLPGALASARATSLPMPVELHTHINAGSILAQSR